MVDSMIPGYNRTTVSVIFLAVAGSFFSAHLLLADGNTWLTWSTMAFTIACIIAVFLSKLETPNKWRVSWLCLSTFLSVVAIRFLVYFL